MRNPYGPPLRRPVGPPPKRRRYCSPVTRSTPDWVSLANRLLAVRDFSQSRLPQEYPPCGHGWPPRRRYALLRRRSHVHFPSEDRKRVVYGKSMSVRLELGGRLIIKNKKNK